MIVYNNADTGEQMAFYPSGKEGEFTIISPDGSDPAAMSPETLKIINLMAEARKVNTEEDLKEFEKKLDVAFPDSRGS